MQDTFKATSRLTLNLGLRYDLPFPYTEIKNRQTLWIPGRQSTVMPDAPNGLLYPGDKGVPAGLIPTFMKGFAPRVGLAWDPTGTAKWLVTSAYGIFYEPYYTGQGGPLQSPISAPPFLQTPQVSTPDFADPFGRQSSHQWPVLQTSHQLDTGCESAPALYTGLGSEYSEVFRIGHAIRSRLCGHKGNQAAAHD